MQATLSDVFENMGWKVYRVTETATVLLGGGVAFAQLDPPQAKEFQRNLLRVMISLEDTYVDLARYDISKGQRAIVICDRGAMDPSAYMPREEWLETLSDLGLNEISLRDERYDCVVHLVTAANGAEEYFGSENNRVRSEGLDLARHLDDLVSKAWIGHPYYDIIDNSTGFEEKQHRAIASILKRLGLYDIRQGKDVVKRKFLVSSFDLQAQFPVAFRDFEVEHDYLMSSDPDTVTRIRKRGYDNNYVYSITQCVTNPTTGERYETRRAIPGREYSLLWHQRDHSRCSIIKKRRCFLYSSNYYQIDCYQDPNPGLVLLEAYLKTTSKESSILPPFIHVVKEVTNDPSYSMFQLSKINKDVK